MDPIPCWLNTLAWLLAMGARMSPRSVDPNGSKATFDSLVAYSTEAAVISESTKVVRGGRVAVERFCIMLNVEWCYFQKLREKEIFFFQCIITVPNPRKGPVR
jgi:hypothetical protein